MRSNLEFLGGGERDWCERGKEDQDHLQAYLQASGERAPGRKRELPLERDVRKAVLRTNQVSVQMKLWRERVEIKLGAQDISLILD